MKITIHNPSQLPVIDYRKIIPIQGDLKELSPDNYQKLKKSIEENGFKIPAFLWKPTQNEEAVVDGKSVTISKGSFYNLDSHQRIRVLTKENASPREIPYVLIHAENFLDAKKTLLLISSQYGTLTAEGFDNFSFDIDEKWIKEVLNFDSIDLDFENVKESQATEDNYVIPKDVVTDIKLGDIFLIGRHKLLCGSAIDVDDVNKLLCGKKPNLMITDPPYGVEYDPQWRHKAGIINSGRTRAVKNDDNARWPEAYKSFPGNVIYVWCASLRSALVHQDIVDSGFVPNYLIIWNKQQLVFGRGHYHWKHEPCWQATRIGKPHDWIGDRKQTTVWDIDNLLSKHDTDSKTVHGTQKPVECMARPIRNHSGDVYDPFIGSGTTMVAGDQLGRTVYAMDISPECCQIVIDRMIALHPNIIIKKNGEPYTKASEEKVNVKAKSDVKKKVTEKK